jgi:hypothetical protein
MRIIFIFLLFMISCKKENGVLPQNNLTIKTAQIHKVKPKKKIKLFKKVFYFYRKKPKLNGV